MQKGKSDCGIVGIYICNERTFVAPERARHVNHTPADLGGLTSFLYELDASYERSFVGSKI